MPRILHILTRPDDALAREIIALQNENQRDGIEIVDLTKPRPDYGELLEKIFAADSVESW
ncbi:MAG TPA: hypothetical protein VMQ67_08575 [Candidatus Saccharimonadales bacterium]|jgi:hypothetical protein|nr:hypothetical protein [Candidatus Saccharimonadales bacterium]